MKVFKCVECGVEVTRPVEPGARRSPSDGAPLVEPGRFVEVTDEYEADHARWLAIHLGDALNTREHSDDRRLNGCCGKDGLDGLNTVCANGHEIGTEKSDCWMPHALLLDPSRVTVR